MTTMGHLARSAILQYCILALEVVVAAMAAVQRDVYDEAGLTSAMLAAQPTIIFVRSHIDLVGELPQVSAGADISIVGLCGPSGQEACVIDADTDGNGYADDQRMFVVTGGRLTIANLHLRNGYAQRETPYDPYVDHKAEVGDGGGGLLFVLGGDVLVVGCILSDGVAIIGGAIYVNELTAPATVTINGCEFSRNMAVGKWGAILVAAGVFKMDNCLVSLNTANSLDQSVLDQLDAYTDLSEEYTDLSEETKGMGGGILAVGGSIEIRNTAIIGNEATLGGGFCFVTAAHPVVLYGVRVDENVAVAAPGGFTYVSGEMRQSSFTNNHVKPRTGGGSYSFNGMAFLMFMGAAPASRRRGFRRLLDGVDESAYTWLLARVHISDHTADTMEPAVGAQQGVLRMFECTFAGNTGNLVNNDVEVHMGLGLMRRIDYCPAPANFAVSCTPPA
eukprot:jgi/Mesvir1/2938/Mv14004-RA.1